MRKHTLLFLFFAGLSLSLFGQSSLRTLFVNDNSVIQANTDTILSALTLANIEYDYFDARINMRSPTAEELHAYDLVIWYCSTDGVGNYFWSGNDSDNPDLTAYLESGGILWVMGNDFLYDRYAAPVIFNESDFVFNYLGLWEYHAQSYGDDGGLGVERLDLRLGALTSVETIHWIYPTAWWIDACVPVPTAVTVYDMAPDNYGLSGYSSAIMNTTLKGVALSFFFDPALIDYSSNRVKLFKDVMAYFTLHAGMAEKQPEASTLSSFPNPFTTEVTIMLPTEFRGTDAELEILKTDGQRVMNKHVQIDGQLLINMEAVPAGVYILKVTGLQRTMCKSLLKL